MPVPRLEKGKNYHFAEIDGDYCAAWRATGLLSGLCVLYDWECRKRHNLAHLGVLALKAAPALPGKLQLEIRSVGRDAQVMQVRVQRTDVFIAGAGQFGQQFKVDAVGITTVSNLTGGRNLGTYTLVFTL
jgi:hypothetical protein